jgi:hypothetical protein
VHAPDRSGAKLAALVVFHAGGREAAERELAPFTAFGSPLMVQVGPLPYPVMNTTDPAGTDANVRWTRETFAGLRPHFATGRWLNYLGDDQGDEAIRTAYGPNYRFATPNAATTPTTSSPSTTTSRRSADS